VRSESARQILERIGWRGYIPPEAADDSEADVDWQLPVDQIDLIRSVLRRNRRLGGQSAADWQEIDHVCEAIAETSSQKGVSPNYRSGT
jgi:hypothetical protein